MAPHEAGQRQGGGGGGGVASFGSAAVRSVDCGVHPPVAASPQSNSAGAMRSSKHSTTRLARVGAGSGGGGLGGGRRADTVSCPGGVRLRAGPGRQAYRPRTFGNRQETPSAVQEVASTLDASRRAGEAGRACCGASGGSPLRRKPRAAPGRPYTAPAPLRSAARLIARRALSALTTRCPARGPPSMLGRAHTSRARAAAPT